MKPNQVWQGDDREIRILSIEDNMVRVRETVDYTVSQDYVNEYFTLKPRDLVDELNRADQHYKRLWHELYQEVMNGTIKGRISKADNIIIEDEHHNVTIYLKEE